MLFISFTRLRLRSVRFFPRFALDTYRSLGQVRAAAGFQVGSILADRRLTFWTLTAWASEEDMRRYMATGAHRAAMPKLRTWCDEASVAHWTQPEPTLPTWTEADRRMRTMGRISHVERPSADHAGMRFRAPRTTTAGPILPGTRSWRARQPAAPPLR